MFLWLQPIDSDTHKAMMAHYFRQQEQLKVKQLVSVELCVLKE